MQPARASSVSHRFEAVRMIPRLLSCIRFDEVLVLQGAPLLGALFSAGRLTGASAAAISMLAIGSCALVAHVFALNDWSGMNTDLQDPNRATSVFVSKGIDGADASDIIFNIEGTDSGSTVSLTGNSSNAVIGTILAPQRNVSLSGGGSLTGELIAGVNNAGKSYTVTEASSGYNITGLGYTPYSGGGHVPEPSSLIIYGCGIAALFTLRRYRRSA